MMDLHCHLDLYPEPDGVIKKAAKDGLYVLSVTTTPSAWVGTSNLTKNIPRFSTALGLHPQLAHLRAHELELFDKLVAETRYIGEIGLDGSKNFQEYFPIQERVFDHILSKCEEYPNKILTIHSLNAISRVLDYLEKYPNSGKPILHWFLGTKTQLQRALELNCWFSVGPAMIQSQKGKRVISWIPKNKILLESDGPFAKFKGQAVTPIDVKEVVTYLSSEWDTSIAVVQRQLKENLSQLIKN